MECLLRAVIHDHIGVNSTCIQVHDCRHRNLGIPSWLTAWLRRNPILAKASRILGRFGDVFKDIYHLFELYYLASERAPILTVHYVERKISSTAYSTLIYSLKRIKAAFSSLGSSSLPRHALDYRYVDRDTVFEHCYFGHCLVVVPATNSRGILLCSGINDSTVKFGHNRMRSSALLHLSYVAPGDPDPVIDSCALGYAIQNTASAYSGSNSASSGKGAFNFAYNPSANTQSAHVGEYVSCLTIDPSYELGVVALVCFSNGRVELWKETITLSDLTDSAWESVAWSCVDSYPLFSKFCPSGEVALVLTLDSLYLFEWDGMDLKCIKIVNGASVDFISRKGNVAIAVEWLGPLEFVTLTKNNFLLLSRRSEAGQWLRVAQYNIQDVFTDIGNDVLCGVARLQYDGKNQLFLKTKGSSQLIHLKWTQRAIPDCSIVELPCKLAKADAYVKVADFTLCPDTGLLAICHKDRTCVLVYSISNFRFLQKIDPPKGHFRAVGISFMSPPLTSGVAYLAVRWVTVPLELMEASFYDLDPLLFREKLKTSRKCTALYKFATGLYKTANWTNQSLAEILAGSEVDVGAGVGARGNRLDTVVDGLGGAGGDDSIPNVLERNVQDDTLPIPSALFPGPRWNNDPGKRLPKSSILEPLPPKKLVNPLIKHSLSADTFGNDPLHAPTHPHHRHTRFDDYMSRGVPPLSTDLKLDGSDSFAEATRVYSIDEFRRNRRGNSKTAWGSQVPR